MTLALLVLQLTAALPPADTARLIGDTLLIEPVGIGFTVPQQWMGRIPEGVTDRNPGPGRSRCQLLEKGPIADRIVTERERFPSLRPALYADVRTAQDGLDSLVPFSDVVASLGGARLGGGCWTSHVWIYVTSPERVSDTASAGRAQAGMSAGRKAVGRSDVDSAGWQINRFTWSETHTDVIFDGTLEVWSRMVGEKRLILGLIGPQMSVRGDVFNFVSSMRASVR